MPTPNVYVQAQSNPFADVAPPLRTNTVDVLYATDRKPVPQDDGTLAYGSGRSFSLAVGSCVVAIGQDMAWDTLVEQSQQAERTQPLPLRKDQTLLLDIGPAGYSSWQITDDSGSDARNPGVQDEVHAGEVQAADTAPAHYAHSIG